MYFYNYKECECNDSDTCVQIFLNQLIFLKCLHSYLWKIVINDSIIQIILFDLKYKLYENTGFQSSLCWNMCDV